MKDAIKTIIWDLDNTLYKFDDKQIEMWHHGVIENMSRNGIQLPYETAMDKAHRGWIDHRDSNHYFVKEHGLCPNEAHLGMFAYLDHTLINPCPETPNLMPNMRHYRHAIVTYATKDWARRILDHTGLSDFFETDLVIGAEDYGFEDKASSSRGVQTMLDKLGGNAPETLFVEDTYVNLKPAAGLGVKTAWLHHGREVNDNEVGFVDIVVHDTPELLDKLK